MGMLSLPEKFWKNGRHSKFQGRDIDLRNLCRRLGSGGGSEIVLRKAAPWSGVSKGLRLKAKGVRSVSGSALRITFACAATVCETWCLRPQTRDSCMEGEGLPKEASKAQSCFDNTLYSYIDIYIYIVISILIIVCTYNCVCG